MGEEAKKKQPASGCFFVQETETRGFRLAPAAYLAAGVPLP
jgi:hypothetical protein